MTDRRPGNQPQPFGPDELAGVSGVQPDELMAEMRLARELEVVAARASVRPSAAFTDRVMAAVAREPVPAPVRAAGTALRRGALVAFVASLRDAWRVTVSPSFPMAMRAQAMALVLVVAGLAAGSGAVTAGALGLFDGDRATPTPPVETPSPSIEATPEPSMTPDPTMTPQMTPQSPEPSGSDSPSPSMEDESGEPSGSPEPTETAEPSDDASATPTRNPSPTRTPSPTRSPSDDSGHSEEPSTPKPSETPDSG